MRRLLAQFEYDPKEFANALKQRLEMAVKHLYADHSVSVSTYLVTPNRYGVSISILNGQGQLVLNNDVIKVENNQIILDFDKD